MQMMSCSNNILVIRHLPNVLTDEEKEDLLKHFGATQVRCMPNQGRMKNMMFATFLDDHKAAQALARLHQLKILGHTLVVEYARSQREIDQATPSVIDRENERCAHSESNEVEDKKENKISEKQHLEDQVEEGLRARLQGITPSLRLTYAADPGLHYLYPTPTVEILTNIANALASVPKFYVQVLHLMNKMNLPAPFGPLTATPPLPSRVNYGHSLEVAADMEMSSSSQESELESEEEENGRAKRAEMPVVKTTRPRIRRARKRPRLQDFLQPAAGSRPGGGEGPTAQEIFEQPQATRRGELRLAQSIASAVVSLENRTGENTGANASSLEPAMDTTAAVDGTYGFGKFEPARVEVAEREANPGEEEHTAFISLKELKSKIISSEEMGKISAFKKYEPGDPTSRLYIKNISKHATDKDLTYIFGRYVNQSSDLEKDMFNIRLMKEGRMNGQAFIGLPSEESAQKALRETNGYMLHGKPIVVHFARSAKPKEKNEKKR